jgi:hypothetical protein
VRVDRAGRGHQLAPGKEVVAVIKVGGIGQLVYLDQLLFEESGRPEEGGEPQAKT